MTERSLVWLVVVLALCAPTTSSAGLVGTAGDGSWEEPPSGGELPIESPPYVPTDPPPEALASIEVRGRRIVFIEVPEHSVPVVDGEFVVQLHDDADLAAILGSEPFVAYGAEAFPLTGELEEFGGPVIYRMDFPTGLEMAGLQAQISANPLVERSDPNVLSFVTHIPGDAEFRRQWPLINTGQTGGRKDADIDADVAWEVQKGKDAVRVFVLDTGIAMRNGALSHPDLDSALVRPDANFMGPGGPEDGMGHGTHVAGIIGAEMDNLGDGFGGGVVGVCPGCGLWIVQMMNDQGGTTLDIETRAVSHVLASAAKNKVPHVVNMSWRLAGGFDLVGEQTFESLIAMPSKKGMTNILFVAAAGNYPPCPAKRPVMYPAAYAAKYAEMVAVAATNHKDDPACWSAFGPQVTVAAPGENVYSTTPNYPVGGCPPPQQNFDLMSGTSMAAPHVAGLAGLVWSAQPDLTASEVRQLVERGAQDVGAKPYVNGRNDYMGEGRVNACFTLHEAGLIADPLVPCAGLDLSPPVEPPIPVGWPNPLGVPVPVPSPFSDSGALRLGSFLAPYLVPFVGLALLRKRRGGRS